MSPAHKKGDNWVWLSIIATANLTFIRFKIRQTRFTKSENNSTNNQIRNMLSVESQFRLDVPFVISKVWMELYSNRFVTADNYPFH